MAGKITDEPSLEKRSAARANLSLAAKGLIMLGAPLLFQMCFIGLLVYLQDRTEAYAVRAGNSRNLSTAINRFSLYAGNAVCRIDDSVWQHRAIDAQDEQAITECGKQAQPLISSLHNRMLSEKMYAAINEQSLPQEIAAGWRQLLQRRQLDVPPTSFELQSAALVKKTVADLGTAFAIANVASTMSPDSPQYQRAIEKVRVMRRAVIAQVTQMAGWSPAKIALTPEFFAVDRENGFFLVIAGCAINIAIVLLMILYFSRDIVRRVLVMLDNSVRLAMERPLHPPLPGNDEIAKLDRSFHDMADALTEALNKQRSLIENAQDVICSIDETGKFVAINSASQALFGYMPEDLVGGNLLNLLPDEDATSFSTRLKAIKAGDHEPFEMRMIKKGGRIIDILWSATWSPVEQTLFCVAHDITDRKGAERLRQEVMQMVSHDLRTPLTTMRSFHEMLEHGLFGVLSDPGKQSLEIAERSTQRMLRLINDLLEIEKMESGVLALDISYVALVPILEQSVQSVLPIARSKGVIVDLMPTALSAYADADRLQQILVNLLANAVKFTAPHRKVTLSAQALDGFVEVRVADQGRGIPRAMLSTIFDRFKQVQSADGKGGKGFGLGLAICKALVELHGGDISVVSEEEVGSTFSFRIPSRSVIKAAAEQPDSVRGR